MPTHASLKQFHQRLDAWYQQYGRRDLPWRHTPDPYHILVSEIMLQQTQVATVLDRYYHPFLEAFPNLTALAKVDIEEVMKLWQGLGYYRRAKFLHETAKRAAPNLPDNVADLMALPGIGRNTAHALLAFAFKQPYPVMEANVKRVLCRIFALSQPTDAVLWQYAFKLLNTLDPFDYNQAMMDVGAMLCTPKNPKCDMCPAAGLCQGKGSPESYPTPKAKKQAPVRKQQILIVKDKLGKIYAQPREGNFLQGLYQFIELAADETAIELNGTRYEKNEWSHIGQIEQVYSHFKQQADIYLLDYHGKHRPSYWYTLSDAYQLPLSKKEQKILVLITKNTLP